MSTTHHLPPSPRAIVGAFLAASIAATVASGESLHRPVSARSGGEKRVERTDLRASASARRETGTALDERRLSRRGTMSFAPAAGRSAPPSREDAFDGAPQSVSGGPESDVKHEETAVASTLGSDAPAVGDAPSAESAPAPADAGEPAPLASGGDVFATLAALDAAADPGEDYSVDGEMEIPSLATSCLNENATFLAATGALGVPHVAVIYSQNFVVNGIIDEMLFMTQLASMVAPNDQTLVVINYEGPLNAINNQPIGSPFYESAEQKLITVLELARALRPNARFAIYNAPAIKFYLKNANGSVIPWNVATPAEVAVAQAAYEERWGGVIAASDWLNPSIYDFHSDEANPATAIQSYEYSRNKTQISKNISGGRPVLPMLWHRYHPSSQTHALKLIPLEEMVGGQVQPAFAGSADGVVWWGSDYILAYGGVLQEKCPEEFPGVDLDDFQAVLAAIVEQHVIRINALAATVP